MYLSILLTHTLQINPLRFTCTSMATRSVFTQSTTYRPYMSCVYRRMIHVVVHVRSTDVYPSCRCRCHPIASKLWLHFSSYAELWITYWPLVAYVYDTAERNFCANISTRSPRSSIAVTCTRLRPLLSNLLQLMNRSTGYLQRVMGLVDALMHQWTWYTGSKTKRGLGSWLGTGTAWTFGLAQQPDIDALNNSSSVVMGVLISKGFAAVKSCPTGLGLGPHVIGWTWRHRSICKQSMFRLLLTYLFI